MHIITYMHTITRARDSVPRSSSRASAHMRERSGAPVERLTQRWLRLFFGPPARALYGVVAGVLACVMSLVSQCSWAVYVLCGGPHWARSDTALGGMG